jgi:cell wall-associated NlpC family hydrolase
MDDMRPSLDHHAARVCAAIGALGATCAMTLGAQNAAATTNPAATVNAQATTNPQATTNAQATTNPQAPLTARPLTDVIPARSTAVLLAARTAAMVRSVQWMPIATGRAHQRPTHGRRHVDQTRATLRRMVRAGDQIAKLPYVWGGGHGSFDATGYDCSGSVSYVLHGGGLLSVPMDSSGLESYGLPGPGRHVTIYANSQHALMVIDGRRFDTIALQETGTRWSSTIGPVDGYTVRHPAGL